MSRSIFQPEWRTQSRRKRRFYARYMGWLEKTGFVVVSLLLAAFAGSFFYEVDEWVTAEDVPIEAAKAEITADEPIYLMRVLVDDGVEVRKGDPVFWVFKGDEGIRTGTMVDAMEKALQAAQNPEERDRLVKVANPYLSRQPAVITAPMSGTLMLTRDLARGKLDKGAALAVIRDYGHLQVQANLAGKSVAKADVGQRAELTNIRIQGSDDTLLRANLPSGRTAVSRQVVGEDVRKALTDALVGQPVSAREDIPLKVQKIDSIEIEGEMQTASSTAGSLAFDPAPDFKLRGSVQAGKHLLSAQLGDLPAEVRERAVASLKKDLQGKSVILDGKPIQIEALLDPRFVIKLSAEGAAVAGKAISVASLKRSYDATVVLGTVPTDLLVRIKEAHRQGRTVTAKVQVRTGSRPIAYFLLRRS